MIKVVNTTPHDIVMVLNAETKFTFPKAEKPTRLEEKSEMIDYVGMPYMLPIKKITYGTTDIPPKIKDTYYIVSLIVAQVFPEREDFLIVSDTIRDENGRIIGAESFAHV